MPLAHKDNQFVVAARGYVELGMYWDANKELEKITPGRRCEPEVLKVQLFLYKALERWDLMIVVARALTFIEPKVTEWWLAWAFASRRKFPIANSIPILHQALTLYPQDPALLYTIACCECIAGNMNATQSYLQEAFKSEPKYRLIALVDEDLKNFWKEFDVSSGQN